MRYSTVALSIAACLSLSLASVAAHALTPSSSDSQTSKTQKALLIGVDGMQYEKLQEAIAQNMAPHIGSLKLAKSYIGGVDGTSTEQLTNSGPGWATILTGSWVNRHQVDANNGALRNQRPACLNNSSAPRHSARRPVLSVGAPLTTTSPKTSPKAISTAPPNAWTWISVWPIKPATNLNMASLTCIRPLRRA